MMPLRSVIVIAAFLLVHASAALGQQQTAAQQACLNGLNKAGAGVFKAQGQQNLGCVKGFGTGKMTGSVDACLHGDTTGKVGKAEEKATAADSKSCGVAPDFGYTSGFGINVSAVQASYDLAVDVFGVGADIETAVISCSANKPGCLCQQKVLKDVELLASVKLDEFVKCKKVVLKNGADSGTALAKCVTDGATAGSIAADSKRRIAKAAANLIATITKSCDEPNVTAGAFPGPFCNGLAGAALATCLDTRAECRVCTTINEIDRLFVNCDLFDNGVADHTCGSGTGPTPTPTPHG